MMILMILIDADHHHHHHHHHHRYQYHLPHHQPSDGKFRLGCLRGNLQEILRNEFANCFLSLLSVRRSLKGFLKLGVNVTRLERIITGGYCKKNVDVVSQPSKPMSYSLSNYIYITLSRSSNLYISKKCCCT